MSRFLLLLLISGCAKQTVFDLSIPDAPSTVSEAPASDVLEQAGRSNNPSVRVRAIVLGLQTEPERFEQWAGRGTFDPDGFVQQRTADALADIDGPASAEALTALVAHVGADPYARSHAAVRLSERGSHPDSAAVLVAGVQASRDPFERSALALGAIALGDDTVIDALVPAMARGDIALELTFLQDLAHVDAAGLDEALTQAQERVEPELAVMLAATRVERGDGSATSVLTRAFSDDDPLVQLDAIDAIRTLSRPVKLLKAARGARDPVASDYAAIALDAAKGKLTDRSSRGLASEDPELRLAVLDLLPNDDATRDNARNLARVALLDDAPRVRALAARRLGELGLDPNSEDPARIQSALTDENILVRVEAAGALQR